MVAPAVGIPAPTPTRVLGAFFLMVVDVDGMTIAERANVTPAPVGGVVPAAGAARKEGLLALVAALPLPLPAALVSAG